MVENAALGLPASFKDDALRVPGNITTTAEFNFYADPVAAQMVMASGARIVLFPLDVTGQAIMPTPWIASFHDFDTACGKAAGDMLAAYAQFDPLLHDACPVAYLVDASLFDGEARREPIEYCEMKYVPSYRYKSRISKI